MRRMRTRLPTCRSVGFGAFFAAIVSMADRSLKLWSKNRLDDWSIVGCIRLSCLNFWTKVCLPDFLRSRAAPTRRKSEKPRRSREGKWSKRLKRQQQERKEKYRKRQCRANHEQQHQLSKLRATHNVQHQRSGARNFSRWGLPHAPNPTPRKVCDRNCVAN